MTLIVLDLIKAWVFTLGIAIIHTALLGANVGRLRIERKSFTNQEDATKNGGTVGDHEDVVRANGAHRNQLENISLFIAASFIFIAAIPQAAGTNKSQLEGDITGGVILFVLWIAARLGHSFCYYLGLQPGRSICFSLSVLVVFTLSIFAVVRGFEVKDK